MTNLEKKTLVQLLNKYMDGLAMDDTEHQRLAKSDKWYEINRGTKAQYEHARCIVRKLSVEINKEMWAI